MSNGLVEYFGDLPDPRVRGRTDYPLHRECISLYQSDCFWI